MKCPKCGSDKISGLVEAFWVPLSKSGHIDWNRVSLRSETELSDRRTCFECDYEFNEQEAKE